MDLDGGAIVRRSCDRDLELARQIGKFRVQRGPLPHDLGPETRVFDLVRRNAAPLIGGDIADAIAGRLNGMNARLGKVLQNLRHIRELDPVQLQVLPGREVSVAPVVDARHVRKLAKLLRRQRSVGDRDPEHIGVKLQVDAIHEAQRFELILGQLTGKPPRDLIAKLRRPFRDECAVKFIVNIHRGRLLKSIQVAA